MTLVIVVEVEGRLMGMVVDSASQVVRIPADQIDPPPPVFGGFSQEFITGWKNRRQADHPPEQRRDPDRGREDPAGHPTRT